MGCVRISVETAHLHVPPRHKRSQVARGGLEEGLCVTCPQTSEVMTPLYKDDRAKKNNSKVQYYVGDSGAVFVGVDNFDECQLALMTYDSRAESKPNFNISRLGALGNTAAKIEWRCEEAPKTASSLPQELIEVLEEKAQEVLERRGIVSASVKGEGECYVRPVERLYVRVDDLNNEVTLTRELNKNAELPSFHWYSVDELIQDGQIALAKRTLTIQFETKGLPKSQLEKALRSVSLGREIDIDALQSIHKRHTPFERSWIASYEADQCLWKVMQTKVCIPDLIRSLKPDGDNRKTILALQEAEALLTESQKYRDVYMEAKSVLLGL